MLVAKREPFELGAYDRPVLHTPTGPSSSRFTRAMGVLQMVGTLLAVPVGVGSAYTMYKTNFSPEASCQTLRANIVALLDRSVDASTRRILVRRDIEAFERTCGGVDPDATAAFKVLLAADKGTPAAAWVAAPPQPPQTAIRKIEPAKAEPAPAVKAEAALPSAKPKQPIAPTPAAPVVAAASAQPDASVSDAAWVAAVRGALVKHEREVTASIPSAAPAPVSLAPPERTLGELPPPQAMPAAPVTAPVLPPPSAVANVAVPQADPDHPVPPGAIPDAVPQDATQKPSRIHDLVGEIPFFGKTLANHVAR